MLPFPHLPRERAGCSLPACVIAVKIQSFKSFKAYNGKAYSNVSGRTKVKLTAINKTQLSIKVVLDSKILNKIINPFKPNGFFHSYYLEKSILHFRGVRLIFSSLALHKNDFLLSKQ